MVPNVGVGKPAEKGHAEGQGRRPVRPASVAYTTLVKAWSRNTTQRQQRGCSWQQSKTIQTLNVLLLFSSKRFTSRNQNIYILPTIPTHNKTGGLDGTS